MQEIAIIIGLGLLGVLAHSLLKYQSLSTDAQKANVILSFAQYLRNDWTGIMLALVGVVAWPLLQHEIIGKYTALEGLVRTLAFVLGLSGSYVLQLAFSRSKRWIRGVIDRKTNIADAVTD